jgi:hypothetical protein
MTKAICCECDMRQEINCCRCDKTPSAPPAGSIADVIDEFSDAIPDHLTDVPTRFSSGVTLKEMEWKYVAMAMAAEIIKLRR